MDCETAKNTIGETFSSLTRTQANAFGVLGQHIRMDSKLIGSNIALCCRLQLVVSCLQAFWGSLDKSQKRRLSAKKSAGFGRIAQGEGASGCLWSHPR